MNEIQKRFLRRKGEKKGIRIRTYRLLGYKMWS